MGEADHWKSFGEFIICTHDLNAIIKFSIQVCYCVYFILSTFFVFLSAYLLTLVEWLVNYHFFPKNIVFNLLNMES